MCEADHYEVLDLASHQYEAVLSPSLLRHAYKRALLLHHPDKDAGARSGQVTIDDITQAYKTLSDPEQRKDYDRTLRKTIGSDSCHRVHHTGLETMDLEDLNYHEDSNVWSRSCRCGVDGGFLVAESDLERQAKDGELVVGCKGCSLWIRVLFAVEE